MSTESLNEYANRTNLEPTDPEAVAGYTRELIANRLAIAVARGIAPDRLHNIDAPLPPPGGPWAHLPQDVLVDR